MYTDPFVYFVEQLFSLTNILVRKFTVHGPGLWESNPPHTYVSSPCVFFFQDMAVYEKIYKESIAYQIHVKHLCI